MIAIRKRTRTKEKTKAEDKINEKKSQGDLLNSSDNILDT